MFTVPFSVWRFVQIEFGENEQALFRRAYFTEANASAASTRPLCSKFRGTLMANICFTIAARSQSVQKNKNKYSIFVLPCPQQTFTV